jgi:NAD(P)-dependent dehydrogenase (short-subunit alcohol dehydrogenase family)
LGTTIKEQRTGARLTGESALITGAGHGIGRQIATTFAAEGAQVVAFDLDGQALDRFAAEHGGTVTAVRGDVSSRADIERAVELAIRLFGKLDIAVCNAGLNRYRPFLELDDETWHAHLNVDLTGVFLTAQVAARAMLAGAGGSIIVITSAGAAIPSRTQSHYCAAKAGARMLAQAMAYELSTSGIRVNTIEPGWVETRLTADYLQDPALRSEVEATIPLHRIGQPEDVAQVALFLADGSRAVTGAHLLMDGGLTVGRDKK